MAMQSIQFLALFHTLKENNSNNLKIFFPKQTNKIVFGSLHSLQHSKIGLNPD
jgi:hypothetical protein